MFMKNLKLNIQKMFNICTSSGLVFIIGLLGAYAGSEGTSKQWRRILIPIIFTACALIEIQSLWCVLVMTMCAFLSMGYGIPDAHDEGSKIGRFYYNLFNHNHFLADVFTRGTIGFGIALSLLVITILKQNWFVYSLSSLGIILIYALNSWRGYGQIIFTWKTKTYCLLKVDIVTYTVLGICGLLIIFQ